ncbi:hypothetical protein [Ferrimonas kyonanensis]|uniref:hypothetical protein n=1 Tax=Ferrimonas kyonanensis TaxID=364763 RepID=UPI0012EC35B3|nr:hypothetical protein [Ferrimonas kyonanensis]
MLNELNPSLSTTITNPVYYTVPALTSQQGKIEASILQNHLTVMINRAAIDPYIDRERGELKNPFIGYLYLSAGGFNLTIELRATLDRALSPSNIIFDISNEDREYLISESVKRRTSAMEKEYRQKSEALEIEARKRALAMIGELSVVAPSVTRIRENQIVRTGDGYVMEVQIREIHQFESFRNLIFTLTNQNSVGVGLQGISLYQMDDEGKRNPIAVYHRCEGMIERFGEKECVITTTDSALDSAAELMLQIDTNVGGGVVQW